MEDVQKGEDVIIAKPVRHKQKPEQRKMGLLKGKIWISDDFDEEDEEINKLFGTS